MRIRIGWRVLPNVLGQPFQHLCLKTLRMPLNNCIWLHDVQDAFQVAPDATQHSLKQPVYIRELLQEFCVIQLCVVAQLKQRVPSRHSFENNKLTTSDQTTNSAKVPASSFSDE